MNTLRNIIDKVETEIRYGNKTADEAIIEIANKYGFDIDGDIVAFLKDRFKDSAR